MQEWRDVPGYEGYYQVSNDGEVRSLTRTLSDGRTWKGRKLKGGYFSNGYRFIMCRKDGKYFNFSVHRMVAMAFIPNPENYQMVNHKDGNKKNNHVSNLEWVSGSENQCHSVKTGLRKTKLTKDDVKKIKELSEQGESQDKIGKMFNVSQVTISHVLAEKVGYLKF